MLSILDENVLAASDLRIFLQMQIIKTTQMMKSKKKREP